MKKFLQDFKDFAMKGNVVDMAVGVVIGAAFGKIVSSLVNDIIMPLVGVLTGGTNFSEFKFILKPAAEGEGGEIIPEVAVNWGMFVQNIVDFLIIAFCIFLAIKVVGRLRRKQAEEPKPEEPKGPSQEELLTEIRDLLKKEVKEQAPAKGKK